MPALMKTDLSARVTWLGTVTDPQRSALLGEALQALDLTFDGIPGSMHGGRTRPSCSRVTGQHRKGTEIANVRQLSIVSSEDLAAVAAKLGLDGIDPARLGASIVVEGLADFTHLPPSSRLQGPSGVTLVVDMENRPCQFPAKSLESVHPGQGKGFKAAAKGRRGVTAWVERPGTIALGDVMRLHIPDQPVWAGLEAARRA
jgi:MOSC domain-containing protein YiiM